jgi:hypothetical protein
MLERFTADAELEVAALSPQPWCGVGAIRSAYLERPPTEEIVLLEAWETAEGVAGSYAWSSERAVAVGELRLTVTDGRVERVVVTGS